MSETPILYRRSKRCAKMWLSKLTFLLEPVYIDHNYMQLIIRQILRLSPISSILWGHLETTGPE